MILVENYNLSKDENGRIAIKHPPPAKCPQCGKWMWSDGCKERRAKNSRGEAEVYRLRRLRCKRCGKVHIEIPTCIIPYKRYNAESIENPDVCSADESTIRRWGKGK